MQDFIDKHLAEIIQLKEHPPVQFDVDLQAVAAKYLNLTDGQRVAIDSVEMPKSVDEPVVLRVKGRVTNKP